MHAAPPARPAAPRLRWSRHRSGYTASPRSRRRSAGADRPAGAALRGCARGSADAPRPGAGPLMVGRALRVASLASCPVTAAAHARTVTHWWTGPDWLPTCSGFLTCLPPSRVQTPRDGCAVVRASMRIRAERRAAGPLMGVVDVMPPTVLTTWPSTWAPGSGARRGSRGRAAPSAPRDRRPAAARTSAATTGSRPPPRPPPPATDRAGQAGRRCGRGAADPDRASSC